MSSRDVQPKERRVLSGQRAVLCECFAPWFADKATDKEQFGHAAGEVQCRDNKVLAAAGGAPDRLLLDGKWRNAVADRRVEIEDREARL